MTSRYFKIFIFLAAWSSLSYADYGNPLTLSSAIQLAINREPTLRQIEANAHSLEKQSIANGQLPDPKLTLGVSNFPTRHPSFTQDDMTMTNVGLTQYFPAGHSLTAKRLVKNIVSKGLKYFQNFKSNFSKLSFVYE